jgi:hypothetical protein
MTAHSTGLTLFLMLFWIATLEMEYNIYGKVTGS